MNKIDQVMQFLREIAMPYTFKNEAAWAIKFEDDHASIAVPADTYEEICRNDLLAGFFDSHYISLGHPSALFIYHFNLKLTSKWLH